MCAVAVAGPELVSDQVHESRNTPTVLLCDVFIYSTPYTGLTSHFA